jgi:cyclophilin family peptidyl-prolyl cis-trans isomerase
MSEPPAVAGGSTNAIQTYGLRRVVDQKSRNGSRQITRPPPQAMLTCTLQLMRLSLPAILKSNRREYEMANRTATIETNKGTIKFELLEEDAPKTTENFRLLAERGYYDGVIFHRCIKGFMIQGGDPDGTGRGGQSAWGGKFADEINSSSDVYKRGYKAGTVAMANAGPNTNGSQFFIMHADYPLPPSYTIFGRVTEGQEVVDAIATSETDRSDRPASEVKMEKVSVA